MSDIDSVNFTETEKQIFDLLNANIGDYVSLKEIDGLKPIEYQHLYIWNYRIHVSAIRNKIKAHGLTIKNLRGKGYKLEKLNA